MSVRQPIGTALCLVLLVGLAGIAAADEEGVEIDGSLGLELRYFPHESAVPEQFEGTDASLVLQLEFRKEWLGGNLRLDAVPFVRLDQQDQERTHADMREFVLQWIGEKVEIRAGSYKVFWGVAESYHLVDVVNQTDSVENVDGEDKLGQPMINLTYRPRGNRGTLDAFVMPYFRERTLPGPDGRLRFQLPYAMGAADYESSAGRSHLDGALRYSRTTGRLDLGVALFHGTCREPRFRLAGSELVPVYDVVTQFGLDSQYTVGGWLWKVELVSRRGSLEPFVAAVGGFEYTLTGVLGSAVDVGVLAEIHTDGRDPLDPPIPFDEDVFVGSRIAFNDIKGTELLLGVTRGLDGQGLAAGLEFARRLGKGWRLEGEARFFDAGSDPLPVLSAVTRDDYLQLALVFYF
jgi:hypothetical protein